MKQNFDKSELKERIITLRDMLGYSNSMLAKKAGIDQGNFSKKIKGDLPFTTFDIDKISKNLDVSELWLTTGQGSIFLSLEQIDARTRRTDNNKLHTNTRPRLPISASAGHLTEYISGVMRYECEEMPVIKRFPDYDFTMFIRGNSMEPKYEGGDEIALKKATIIESGKDYVLATNDGPIFKKIYDEGDCIRCVSYNHDEYPDFLVPKENIFGYYRFVGLIRV